MFARDSLPKNNESSQRVIESPHTVTRERERKKKSSHVGGFVEITRERERERKSESQ